MASLFTYINKIDSILRGWGTAIIISILKKGKEDNPVNYCPVSLLSTTSKIMLDNFIGNFYTNGGGSGSMVD